MPLAATQRKDNCTEHGSPPAAILKAIGLVGQSRKRLLAHAPLQAFVQGAGNEVVADVLTGMMKESYTDAETLLKRETYATVEEFASKFYNPAEDFIDACVDYKRSAISRRKISQSEANKAVVDLQKMLKIRLQRLCEASARDIYEKLQASKKTTQKKKGDDDEDGEEEEDDEDDGKAAAEEEDDETSEASASSKASAPRKRATPPPVRLSPGSASAIAGRARAAANNYARKKRRDQHNGHADASKQEPQSKRQRAGSGSDTEATDGALANKMNPAQLAQAKKQLLERAAAASEANEEVVALQRALAEKAAIAHAKNAAANASREVVHRGLGGGTVLAQALSQIKDHEPTCSNTSADAGKRLLAELERSTTEWEAHTLKHSCTDKKKKELADQGYCFTEQSEQGLAMAKAGLHYVQWRAHQRGAEQQYTSVAGQTRAYGDGEKWPELRFVAEAFGRVLRKLSGAKASDAYWSTMAVPFVGPLGLLAQVAHQDITTSLGHSFHFPLLDASAQSSTMLFPHTHNASKLEKARFPDTPLPCVSFEMKAGSFLIFSTRLWHYGQAIYDSLQLRFFSYIEKKGVPLQRHDPTHVTVKVLREKGYRLDFQAEKTFDNGRKIYNVDIEHRD